MRNPVTFLFSLITACALSFPESHLCAAELPDSPVELKELAQKFVDIRTTEVDEPSGTRKAKLNEDYLAALDNASKQAVSEGDLETVLELKKEAARLKKSEPLSGAEVYKQDRVKKLASTYLEYLTKVSDQEQEKRTELLAQFDNALEQLQSELTRQGRIEDAISVKAFRDGADPGELIGATGRDGVSGQSPVVAAAKPEMPGTVAKVEGISAISAELPLAPGPTRVVIVPIRNGGAGHSTFDAVQAADMQDIVFVGRTLFPNIGAIRADGALVYWNPRNPEPEIVPGSNVYCEQSYESPLVGLNADGTISCTSDATSDLIQQLKSQTEVVHMAATSAVISLVKTDGSVTCLGTRIDVPTASFLAEMTSVKAVGWAGASFASVLKSDGSVVDISNGSASTARVPEISKLHTCKLAEDEKGNPVCWGELPQTQVDEAERNPRMMFYASRRFGAIREDGEVYLSMSDDSGKWEKLSTLCEALEGAISLTWAIHPAEDWIVAVLPADTVSRSGVWKAEDLIQERASR